MFKNPPQLSVSKSCVLAAVAGGSGSGAFESLHEGCWWWDLVITSLSREQGKPGKAQGGLAAGVCSRQAPCTHPLLVLFKTSLKKGFPHLMPSHQYQ